MTGRLAVSLVVVGLGVFGCATGPQTHADIQVQHPTPRLNELVVLLKVTSSVPDPFSAAFASGFQQLLQQRQLRAESMVEHPLDLDTVKPDHLKSFQYQMICDSFRVVAIPKPVGVIMNCTLKDTQFGSVVMHGTVQAYKEHEWNLGEATGQGASQELVRQMEEAGLLPAAQ